MPRANFKLILSLKQPLTLNVSDTSTLVPPAGSSPTFPLVGSLQHPDTSSYYKPEVVTQQTASTKITHGSVSITEPPSHQESSPALEPPPPAFTPLQERMLQVPLTLCIVAPTPQDSARKSAACNLHKLKAPDNRSLIERDPQLLRWCGLEVMDVNRP
ncbi:hypothetical protein BC826DRAFT_1110760 [Russula brevipes]|nr:hypothetical protein BC826DRAFT_1110760 [Russula brevipes]